MPWYFAEASKTICVSMGIMSGFTMGKWGRNHLVESALQSQTLCGCIPFKCIAQYGRYRLGQCLVSSKAAVQYSEVVWMSFHNCLAASVGLLSTECQLDNVCQQISRTFRFLRLNSVLNSRVGFTLVNSINFPELRRVKSISSSFDSWQTK